MRNISRLAFAFTALSIASPVLAQSTPPITSGRSDITIAGFVPPLCTLSAPTMTGDGTFVLGNTTSGTVTLSGLIDINGAASGLNLQFIYPSAMCNFAAHLSLMSANGGLRPSGVPSTPGFSTVINYTATAIWGQGGPQTSLDTSANTLKGNNNGVSVPPKSDQLILNIVTKSTALPLLNVGSPYTDVLSVQVGEAL